MQDEVWKRLKPYLDQYNLKVLDAATIGQDVFLVNSDRRRYEGRFAPEAVASMKMRVGDYAASRRFRRTPRFLLNMYYDPMIPASDGNVFYMTDAWTGANLQMTPTDVEQAVVNLANLHAALEGCGDVLIAEGNGQSGERSVPVEQSSVHERLYKPRYGTWTAAFSRGAERFAAERLAAAGQHPDRVWSDWLKTWEEQAADTAARLHHTGYAQLAEASDAKKEVAWNDYRLPNLRRVTNGQIATLQPASPVFDTLLYDLSTLCSEICARGHGEGVLQAIDRYAQIRPLDPEQKQIVAAFAAYPHTPLAWLLQLRRTGTTAIPADWLGQAELLKSAADLVLQRSFG